jgi:DNA-binding NarL/FixJ family response regulator
MKFPSRVSVVCASPLIAQNWRIRPLTPPLISRLATAQIRSARLSARSLACVPASDSAARVSPPPELTEREVGVVQLIGRGRSNSEIAAELFLSETTVKTHVTRIFTKLRLRDRAQAVVLAYETGLVTPHR